MNYKQNMNPFILTLHVTPVFSFSPPFSPSVWKPDLHKTTISMGEVLDVILCKHFWWLKSWVLPLLCPQEVWSCLTVSLLCIYLHTGCERILVPVTEKWISVLFSEVRNIHRCIYRCLPSSSAVLCSWVKVVRFRYWTLLGFWSLSHTVSNTFLWLISSWGAKAAHAHDSLFVCLWLSVGGFVLFSLFSAARWPFRVTYPAQSWCAHWSPCTSARCQCVSFLKSDW